jgi:hypothetical protein
MSSTATHCEHCGAAVRTANAVFCEYCGTKLPERSVPPQSSTTAPASPFGDRATRFSALHVHPEREALQTAEVNLARHALGLGFQVAFLIVFVVIALTMAGGACTMGAGASAMGVPGGKWAGGMFTLVPLLIGGVGVAMLVALLSRSARFASSPLERLDRLWIDERTEISGGSGDSSASTTYYATLESADGQRREFKVGGKLTGRCSPGDMGVAFVKGDVLVDFRRVPV